MTKLEKILKQLEARAEKLDEAYESEKNSIRADRILQRISTLESVIRMIKYEREGN